MARRRAWGVALVAVLVVLIGAALPACGGSATAPTATTATATTPAAAATGASGGGKVFTPAELAAFDGQDGRPAYVAVDGVVYDVSASASWPQGRHTRCSLDSMAGRDLSAEIKQAPANMRGLLEQMPVVGSLAQ